MDYVALAKIYPILTSVPHPEILVDATYSLGGASGSSFAAF